MEINLKTSLVYYRMKEWGDIASSIEENGGICLIATPDEMAIHYGVRYYIRCREKLQKQIPFCAVTLRIDCGESPGFALEAIHGGVNGLYFSNETPYAPLIESICQQKGILFFNRKDLL